MTQNEKCKRQKDKRGIFKNNTFIFKNVPCGSEKRFVAKIIFFLVVCTWMPTHLIFSIFSWGEFFWATGYLFEYERVVLEDTPLFHVWGTIIGPNLWWNLKEQIWICELAFLKVTLSTILWSFRGLLGLFTYRTRANISRGLYIFYPIFKDHFFVFKEPFSENSVLMYSRAACNQERLTMARVR